MAETDGFVNIILAPAAIDLAKRKEKWYDTYMSVIYVDTGSDYGVLVVEVVRKNVKNINLRLRPDGTPVVSAPPFTPEKRIENFVLSNKTWLVKHLDRRKNYYDKEEQKDLIHQETVDYLGKEYTVVFLDGASKVNVMGDYIAVFAPCSHEKVLEKWWKKEAERIFSEEMDSVYEKFFRPLGVIKPQLSIRRMTSRWGSCNYVDGKVTLSDNLLKGPVECIEYVVLHELTHLLYHDHGKKFHDFIAKCMPDRKERDKKLKEINKK